MLQSLVQQAYSVLFVLFVEKIATFLSKEIGTLQSQVEDDPFLEILTAKRGIDGNYSQPDESTIRHSTPVSLLS